MIAAGLAIALAVASAEASPGTPQAPGKPVMSRAERLTAFRAGSLPLPGTPDLAQLDERLAAAGFKRGAPVYLRIFKDTHELELWMRKGAHYALFATYPICNWDGGLGPKLAEGDRQSPEGLYTVSIAQLRWFGRYRRAFDLAFPNLYDQTHGRTGSAILIHGGCTSVGCFAMTDPVMEELFDLATAAMAAGQPRFAVHVFPFRMTEAMLAASAGSRWIGFWRELQPAYRAFEATRIPPRVGVCGLRYAVREARGDYDGTEPVAAVCSAAGEADGEARRSGPVWPERSRTERQAAADAARQRMSVLIAADKAGTIATLLGGEPGAGAGRYRGLSRKAAAALAKIPDADSVRAAVRCNPNRVSCRRWIALKARSVASGKGRKRTAGRRSSTTSSP
jgi:murein L,D-transpeptidase YafK